MGVREIEPPRLRAVKAIRRWIADGTLAGRLPSEQELAQRLGMGQMTVHRAMAVLEKDGVILREGPIRFASKDVPVEGTGLMHKTIVVLSPYRSGPVWHRSSGWQEQNLLGAVDAAHADEMRTLVVAPRAITSAELIRMAEDQLVGVVVPDAGDETENHELYRIMRDLRKAHVPLTVYAAAESMDEYDRVCSDQEAGGYQMTRWLIAQGARRIAPVGLGRSVEPLWVRQRREGYRRAICEAGLDLIEPVMAASSLQSLDVSEPANLEAFGRAMAGYLLDRIGTLDAMLCDSDGLVPAVAMGCRFLGRKPNVEIKLVGYDNYWEDLPGHMHGVVLPMASMDKCNYAIGQELVRLLMDRSAGKLPAEPQLREIEPRLVEIPAR